VALTVRPDDEVYQFDTVWLGPDEYTLPIQARYVAWGTWLACFLITAAVLVPLGGSGPGGVVGSLLWSLALSIVASRAVMLVVDHERPLRSLPQLFSAEARAALAARRHGERPVLVRPARVRVRELPERARRIRDRRRRAEQRRVEHRHKRRGTVAPAQAVRLGPARVEVPDAVLPPSERQPWLPPGRSGPVWSAGGYGDWDESDPGEQPWSPGVAARQRPAAAFEYHEPAGREGWPVRPAATVYTANPASVVDQGDHAAPAESPVRQPAQPPSQPPAQQQVQQPADGRRPIEERILLPVRKVR
jgi:hypothetical protein